MISYPGNSVYYLFRLAYPILIIVICREYKTASAKIATFNKFYRFVPVLCPGRVKLEINAFLVYALG